jgi:DNA-binding winged helix-turn-helix (wHTH) protein
VVFRFSRFSLDGARRQLSEGQREIHLSPKALELLLLLVAHRSRAMSKAELQQLLWPSTFVGEANLPTLVAEIRRALHDRAQNSQYVRTVHRFGYRFVAEVAEDPVAPGANEPGPRMYVCSADQRFPLTDGMTLIGRGDDVTVRADSGSVSRHHARIIVRGDEAVLEDLGSKNGTFVMGARINGVHVLRDGDQIHVGPVILTFRCASPSRATETMG